MLPVDRNQATDGRLGRIVRLLMDHATVVASGTKIAEEIGTTRSEVWRLIQQLRGLGVDVAGHAATGYRLSAVPDLLLPDILSPLVKGTVFANDLHHFYKIGSTNTEAMQAWRSRCARRYRDSGGGADLPGADVAPIPGIRHAHRESIVPCCCGRSCPRRRC